MIDATLAPGHDTVILLRERDGVPVFAEGVTPDGFTPGRTGGLVSFAPLGEAVESRGGLGGLGAGRTQDGVRTLRANYYRARARGWLSAPMADEMATRLLGRHPSEIWGDAWWACIEHDLTRARARPTRR